MLKRTYVLFRKMGCFGIDDLTREKHKIVYTTELTESQMQVLEKGVDVICVFYNGKVPEPRKFKI